MGVIVNIIGSAITNVKFDGVAIESGFEITKNGTLTFDADVIPAYVNGEKLAGINDTLDLNVSSLSEITIDNESMGFVGATYSFTVNITGFAITQLAPFLTNIANAIRTKKGTTETINAQNFASEIESIESGGGFPIYKMVDSTGYLIRAAIGIIDKNGVYHEYEADFHNNDTSYNVIGSNKMIAFIVSSDIQHFESINSVSGLFNLSTGAVATPSNIYAGAILVLTGDAEISASF